MQEKNLQADASIQAAIEQIQEAASGGVDVMSLAMNPKGAMQKFGGPVMLLVTALQAKNEVVTELMHEVYSLRREVELLTNG
jgi:hypothetical protein